MKLSAPWREGPGRRGGGGGHTLPHPHVCVCLYVCVFVCVSVSCVIPPTHTHPPTPTPTPTPTPNPPPTHTHTNTHTVYAKMMKVLVGEISFIPKSRGQQLIFNFCAFGGLQIDLLPLQPPRQLDRSLRPPRLRVRL
jgi:hypothetical protein